MWLDYTVDQVGENFTVKGDWPGEVMGVMKDGSRKENFLYKPGDVFVVNENGWLIKTNELAVLMAKYEESKKIKNGSSNSDQ